MTYKLSAFEFFLTLDALAFFYELGVNGKWFRFSQKLQKAVFENNEIPLMVKKKKSFCITCTPLPPMRCRTKINFPIHLTVTLYNTVFSNQEKLLVNT